MKIVQEYTQLINYTEHLL